MSAGNIFIDRGNLASSFASYDIAAAQLHEGLSAMVFAEGTRSRDGRLLPFKKGPFILAIRAGVPLVPLYIHGAFERTPKGALNVRPGAGGRPGRRAHRHRRADLRRSRTS